MPHILTPVPVDEINLSDAVEKIRPHSPSIADLLEAVANVDEDSLHSMVEWPGGERECIEDCTPCAAKHAAQVVAGKFLRTIAKQEAAA
ncbi:hypothetical protein ACIRF8_15040 [Streptomyces sp. NPDC102406]|uniref:hypothetical protein n=1 Tax=Streptomyces sp. NPDC102406 TaxID=3366171 RepID=UPI00380444B1